jgi:hypothetical protein
MAELPAITIEPWTGAEINDQTRRVHAESVAYWSRIATPQFFERPAPNVWAPADQVRHLTKSMRAVTTGLSLPWPIVWFRFGRAKRPSMSCSVFSAKYQEALASRPSAGRFAPDALAMSRHTEEERGRIMEFHAVAVDEHCRQLARWSERSLDRYRLQHPVLGKITLREFGFFTLLHNVHHVHVAERRRPQAG